MLNISAQEKQRRARQREASAALNESEPDLIIGAGNIAKHTGQKLSSVYYWHSRGMYGDAVWKAGHKTLCGSKRRLDALGQATPIEG